MSQTYEFKAGSFNNELWMGEKRVFKNLISVDVEFLTAGKWEWVIADAKGIVVKNVPHDGGGWTSIHLPTLGLYGEHSIGFHNLSPGEKKIRSGEVVFD